MIGPAIGGDGVSMVDEVLRRIASRGSKGDPLYTYRVTPEENAQLETQLQNALMLHGRLRSGEEAAAFCLYGAERFRREHIDGPWKWETITSGLDTERKHAKAFNQPNRRKLVEAGLSWWGLTAVETEKSTRFLVTLACQGGLPLKLLRNHNAPLRRFLRAVLLQHEQYPTEDLNDLAVENDAHLPRTLQNAGVHELAAVSYTHLTLPTKRIV